jgi:peptidoglycan-associated lipoprotein
MERLRSTVYVPVILGVLILGMAGCSQKAVQSGGDSQSSTGAAKGADGAKGGASDAYPDLSPSGQDASGGLRGLDKNPSEERVGGSILSGKGDSSNAARQSAEAMAESAAAAAAGLKDVFFGYDSFAISEEGRQALSRDAEWLKANPDKHLKIEGHCDERGTAAYNLVLGEKRAKAVRNYLVELGASSNHLSVVSYGKERPFCADHTESCYSQNRRGHVVIKGGK